MPDSSEASNEADAPGSDIDPADAFSLLGNATRLRIVTALHEDEETPLQFSDLFDRAEVADSGQFNYHLDQLVPHFVERTDDGYSLAAAGKRIARAVSAGLYTDSPTLEPFDLEGECIYCGASALEGAYEDERFSVACGDCGESILLVNAPPSLVRGRSPEEFVDAFERWSRTMVEQATRGLCPECGGTVEPDIDDDPHEAVAVEALAGFFCTVCGQPVVTSFGGVAMMDDTVQAFHDRRGAALEERHYWSIEQFVSDQHTTVHSRDPWSVEVSFYADGDACHVAIDEHLTVAGATIVPGGAPES